MTIIQMTDEERIDWLEADCSRLEDLRRLMEGDDDLDLREAIDVLASQ